jgi:hypothetical protein
MWKQPTRRLSPALVIACIALLISLGGTGYATVLQVPRNSVGTLQLQRNAVKAAKIAPNAVRTGHVLDGTLLTADFKAGQIPQGPKGDKGDTGSAGPPGISGHQIVTSSLTSTATALFGGRVATCPTGKKVLGGGASATTSTGSIQGGYNVLQDGPSGDNKWTGTFNISNPIAGTTFVITVYAICARVS